jgi:hypothetical protein
MCSVLDHISEILLQILPAYAEDLVMEDASVRIKAIKLLGAVFSVI